MTFKLCDYDKCSKIRRHNVMFGLQGRARFQLYQKLIALIFAVAQSYGALLFVRPYVADFDGGWLALSMATLVAGSSIMGYVSRSPPPPPHFLSPL